MIVTLYRCPSCGRNHREIGPQLPVCGCSGWWMIPVGEIVDCGDYALVVTEAWR